MRICTAFVATLFAIAAALPFQAEDATPSDKAETAPPSGLANAQAMNGRTVTASLRYAF